MLLETSSQKEETETSPSLEVVDVKLAQRHLIEFIRQAWHIVEPKTPFVDGWHLHAICDHLEAVSRGEIQDLLINIPPRFMKSLAVCVFFPAWEWIDDASLRYLCSSYGETLSKRDSIKCRAVITSPWYRARWGHKFRLSTDQNEKLRFENNETGYRVSTSVGGMGTGEGGDRIICIPEGYYINTEYGEIDIRSIVEEKTPLKVLSYNHELQMTEFKEIKGYETRQTEEMIEIDLGDGETIECTPDHLIYIEGQGYKKAEDLEEGDIVLYERQLINA